MVPCLLLLYKSWNTERLGRGRSVGCEGEGGGWGEWVGRGKGDEMNGQKEG